MAQILTTAEWCKQNDAHNGAKIQTENNNLKVNKMAAGVDIIIGTDTSSLKIYVYGTRGERNPKEEEKNLITRKETAKTFSRFTKVFSSTQFNTFFCG